MIKILENKDYELWNGDCLELMKDIPDKSVDMILCDLPYGTTKCKWDIVIPFEPLWGQYNRIIKDNGCIALFARQPFASDLVNSNRKMFRYEIIWDKKAGTDFAQANNKPITVHENIMMFYNKKPTYNRIDDTGFKPYSDKRTEKQSSELGAKGCIKREPFENKTTLTDCILNNDIGGIYCENDKIPSNIISCDCNKKNVYHETEKPVELIEKLIRIFSINKEHIILDFTMGSGTTGIAALNLHRKFIGIELDEKYFNIAKERIEKVA